MNYQASNPESLSETPESLSETPERLSETKTRSDSAAKKRAAEVLTSCTNIYIYIYIYNNNSKISMRVQQCVRFARYARSLSTRIMVTIKKRAGVIPYIFSSSIALLSSLLSFL